MTSVVEPSRFDTVAWTNERDGAVLRRPEHDPQAAGIYFSVRAYRFWYHRR
jgi:hypothetical protein